MEGRAEQGAPGSLQRGGGVMSAVAAARYVGKLVLAFFVMLLLGALDW
ncbi:hypothetical protein EV192_114273 [Actinocrispum wychmicini]|uniref:Uncharacterized protein n=1 Tax=Actinocrispum wychmicini TaxID=1213861 RepID=A0A4R2IVZ2_9PSEU|nr:hypothetical protein EV192_114273 [Actinocrispum wychmicini]